MGISIPGIGSNLDVDSIVSKLMQAESAPLATLQRKEASYQAKLSAFGTLSSSLGAFKDAIAKLNTTDTFQSMSANVADSSIFDATATAKAMAGSYSVNVTKLAQAQTLSSTGLPSTTASVGTGKLIFRFGSINGSIVNTGTSLNSSVVTGGIATGALSINGTIISTNSATNNAKALADQINLATGTTGVTASAATDTGALNAFTTVPINSGTFKLDIGGVAINLDTTASPVDGAAIDTALQSASNSLSAAGISFSGSATDGSLKFTRADGGNIVIQQSGTATGGFASVGTSRTFTGAVSLSSANAITVGGSNPAIAGLTAGTFSSYAGATFTQDANKTSGEVTIDSTNNSLQGIRDAINSANLGVTATIVSDGSASPYHLVIKSNKTGETSAMKIDVEGGDAGLTNLLTYDPAGTQKMMQTSAAQSAALTVNGIAVTSETNSVSGAIEGVSLNLAKTGSSSLTVKQDTSGTLAAVNGLVKAYNDLHSTIQKLSGYNADTKAAGILIGDSSVRDVDFKIRQMLSAATTGSNSSLKTLGQIGISIDKTGTMSLDSSKLTSAMSKNMDDVTALFSSMGKNTDSLVGFDSATPETTPGKYDVVVSKLATQGTVVGQAGQDIQSLSINIPTGGSGNTVSMMIDGVSATVSLIPGSYSATQFASQLQSVVNGTAAFSKENISVSVTIGSDGRLNITSNRYGSASKVSISDTGGGNIVSTVMGTPVTTNSVGVDVAGTIGGVAASGSGQYLTGADSSPATGLKLQITGGATGARGSVTFSQGYAFHLNNLVGTFLGNKGLLTNRTDGIKATIKDLDKQTDDLNNRLTDIEKRYRAQFSALDALVSNMNSTSSYLTQQLAQLKANS